MSRFLFIGWAISLLFVSLLWLGRGNPTVAAQPPGPSGRPASAPIQATSGYTTYLPLILEPAQELAWPIDCIPGVSCLNIGYPDIDSDGLAFNCGQPGYLGHQGTDIGVTWEQMDGGVAVFAAGDGEVLWVFDGKYDRCPDDHPDCQPDGYTVCTPVGDFCDTGSCCCSWCFAGGNVVVIRHFGVEGVFATRYDHLRNGSILVSPGEFVRQGQQIAEVGSAGASTGPHLHFEVWGTGFYQLADPWAGACGPNIDHPLWQSDPPWGGSSTAPRYELADRPQPYETIDFLPGCFPAPPLAQRNGNWPQAFQRQ